jgi:phage N-6-adenine-methyltransferase
MNSALMFSKASDEWSTPVDWMAEWNCEFAFDLDAAATFANRTCPEYLGPDHATEGFRDALRVEWAGLLAARQSLTMAVWLNPPYSKCREFIAKAAAEAAKGCTVVCLVPSRTDTRWWHEHVWDAEFSQPRRYVEIRFIKGRLKFGGCANSAPFPSVVIVFRQVKS